MKICQVHPACGISVPPKGWGAIEQIVWEFHQNFLELGIPTTVQNPDFGSIWYLPSTPPRSPMTHPLHNSRGGGFVLDRLG